MRNLFKISHFILFILVLYYTSSAPAAIEVVVDIEGSEKTASTVSDQVFVERVELTFPNQRTSQSVKRASKGFYATARFKYVGNGPLTVRWLVDDRVISQQVMLLTFGKEIEIRSNWNKVDLPTFERGYHRVTLQLINSAGVADQSVQAIRYFVADGINELQSDGSFKLMFPQKMAVNAQSFYFRWQGDDDFRAYQLEVERLATKYNRAQTVLKAMSKDDLYSPTQMQRSKLSPGAYRWRVKGFFVNKKRSPRTTEWAHFEVLPANEPGGLFIKNISARDMAPTESPFASPIQQTSTISHRLIKSQSIISSGKVAAGEPHQLQLEIQNSSTRHRNDLTLEVYKKNRLVGAFPVSLDAGKNTSLSITLEATTTYDTLLQSLTTRLVDNVAVLDEAAINLTIEPLLRLDSLDFNEFQQATNRYPITDPFRCGEGSADKNLAFSRMVSASRSGSAETTQSLLQQGYFSFDQGEQITFNAFFKDKGLGAWFDGPTGRCVRELANRRSITYRDHPLQFIAQPLNQHGQPQGDPFSIGEVTFTTGYEGILTSPSWTIPESGQYQITLNDMGEAADLYATLPGGYPKYIHAAGFIAEVQTPLHSDSAIISTSPRQATLSGEARTKWQGDQSNRHIPLLFDNILLTMSNPLHANLSGGTLQLKKASQTLLPRLHLYDHTHTLRDLSIGLSGAVAQLDYLISPTSKVTFDQVKIFNGGEFIAEHRFNNSRPDLPINNDDLALRLPGSTLVVDASPHLNYTGYINQANFTGIGLHNATVRVRVNQGNGLFSTANPENAFIYGKAPWLSFEKGALSGEQIAIEPIADVAPFFNQKPAKEFTLLQPCGFKLAITGGLFSLQNSQVGGVDFSGYAQLASSDHSPVQATAPFYFNHLVRSRHDEHHFQSEIRNNETVQFSVDSFNYQPASLQLLIGGSAQPNTAVVNTENIERWQNQLLSALKKQSGLLATGGELSKGWYPLGDAEHDPTGGQGAFLITRNGLQGQWREQQESARYELNGFDTSISMLWLQFTDSALVNSAVNGTLNIPYPVDQRLPSSGKLDQQAALLIPANGVTLPESGELNLSYWYARLKMPEQSGQGVPTAAPFTAQVPRFTVHQTLASTPPPIIYDRETQRIKLSDMKLTLEVADNLGSHEFVAEGGAAPFTIDTDILANGQLAQTRVYPGEESLFFIGQPFEASEIKFLPYFKPSDSTATAQPLVEVEGTVFFKVFGSHNVTIAHTALGAQVPEITTLQQGDYGEGAIKVNVQLAFINSYAMNETLASKYIENINDVPSDASIEQKPFKAFVGSADLIIINAVSIKGLAEAGLHSSQALVSPGRWTGNNNATIKAYERIGLGTGVDIFKAAIAGLQGMETVTKLGGAVISAATGVDGTGEKVIKLGTETVTFIQAVAVAVAATAGTAGAGADTIRHAVGSGLSMTGSGIDLLMTICQERSDCTDDQALLLDISSLLVRIAGSITQFEKLTPEEVASISLHTLDIGIPLLMGVNLDAAYEMSGAPPLQLPDGTQITLNDKKNAALSVAHVVVTASRTLLDNNASIPFNDFLRISQKTVNAARSLKAVQGVDEGLSGLDAEEASQLMDLSFDLADASIQMAQGLKSNHNAAAISLLTGQLADLLCQQSNAIQPLLKQSGFADAAPLIDAPVNLSRAMIRALQTLPSNPDEIATFLQQTLSSMVDADAGLQGCNQSPLQLPAAARAALKIAAHSLQPLDGSLANNYGNQIAWALRSVELTIETLQALSPQDLPSQVAEIKTVLQKLAVSFTALGDDLSQSENQTISTQAVMKLAQAIPAAMRELVQSQSTQAAELLDLHIVLMRELQPLIENTEAIASGDLSVVDLYALPLAMINEVQDLSILSQCQKLGLSNISTTLSMARQLTEASPNLPALIEQLNILYQNVQLCDPSGISRRTELAQFMQLLTLMGSSIENPSRIQSTILSALPQLLPFFIESGQQIVSSTQAFASALPIVDFTQDNLGVVLDNVLNRLLLAAEQESSNPQTLYAIQKARAIINNADLNMSGLTLTRNEAGQVVAMEEQRADGSFRLYNFTLDVARQQYPQQHPEHSGGLEELLHNISSDQLASFEQLPAESQSSLFTPLWDAHFNADDIGVWTRRYQDEQKNSITIDNSSGGTVLVQIIDAVSYGTFTPKRLYSITTLPERGASAQTLDEEMEQLFSAEIYREYSIERGCVFTTGCAFEIEVNSGALSSRSVSNAQHLVIYNYDPPLGATLDDIQPAGSSIMLFNGYIDSNQSGWSSDWKVNFKNSGIVSLQQNQSYELLDIGESNFISSLDEITERVIGMDRFIQRRVVNGSNIWDYQAGLHAIHSYGDGEWEVYRMPDELVAGTAVPAPTSTIEIEANPLPLLARGNKNGVAENPAGLSTTGDHSVLTIPAENSDEMITINLTGENAGESTLGHSSLSVSAASSLTPGEIAATEQQADGSQLITLNNGDTQRIHGTREDNLLITQSSRKTTDNPDHSLNIRQVTIQYCSDKNVTWSNCPPPKKVDQRFEYQWITDYAQSQGYVDIDLASRPVITPVAGVNRALKHQFWRDIFALEQSLLQNPSEQGLTQLDALVQRAAEAGLPDEELQAQYRYMTARIINLLMIKQFNEYDLYLTDLAQQNDWKENESASPGYKIAHLSRRLHASEFLPNNNYHNKFRELLQLKHRLYQQQLQGVDLNSALNDTLVNNLAKLIDIEFEMQQLDQHLNRSTDTYILGENVCPTLVEVKEHFQSKINQPNYVLLPSDLEMALEIESNLIALGCGSDETFMADLAELTERAGNTDQGYQGMLQASRLQRLAALINSQNPDEIDLNHDGDLNSQDVISYYLRHLMNANGNATNLANPTPEKFTEWVQHILNIDRIVKEIDAVKNRRNGNVYFYPEAVTDFKQPLVGQLKEAWEAEYQRLKTQFINTSNGRSLDDLKNLGQFYEHGRTLNSRLASAVEPRLLEIDRSEYLKIRIADNEISPLTEMAQQQRNGLDIIWLKTPTTAEWQTTVAQLNQQDSVIRYLQQALPADQLTPLQRLDQQVIERINQAMDQLSLELAQSGNAGTLEQQTKPISQISDFIKSLQMDSAQQYLGQRVADLLNESVARIKNDYSLATAEINKIIQISIEFEGADNISLSELTDEGGTLQQAIHTAGTNALYVVESGGDIDDIAAFITIIAMEAQLGINDPEWEINDIFNRLEQLIDDAEARMLASNDLEDARAYLDLEAYAASLGMNRDANYDSVMSVLEHNQNTLSGCIQTSNCTITHLRAYIEFSASLAGLGGDTSELVTTLNEMAESSPVTLTQSMRYDGELPDLTAVILQDKTGNSGRVAAAVLLERLGNRFSISDEPGRAALRLVIKRIQQLAALPLPSGHSKPDPDPLLYSASNLQQKLDSWLAQLAQQIEQQRSENSGMLLSDTTENVAQLLGVSEQELVDVALAELNGTLDSGPRVIPDNKYRLAANALQAATTLQGDARLRLGLRLLQNMPDPATTAEGDYRMAAIAQLSLFMLESAGEALPGADLEHIKQSPLGSLVVTLLTLPLEAKPVSRLFEYADTHLLSPLLGDGGNALNCDDIYPCLLRGGLQITASVLDSSLQTLQQQNSSGQPALAFDLLNQMANDLSQLAEDKPNDPVIFWSGMAGEAMKISLNLAGRGISDKELIISGLQLSRKLLESPPVALLVGNIAQDLPQAQMAYGFVVGSSKMLLRQLSNNGDKHLPVAIARMAQQQLFETLDTMGLNPELQEVGLLLSNWQLNLADQDKTWGLMTSVERDPSAWIDIFLGEGGIAMLNHQINQSSLLQGEKIPPALALTPFIVSKSLLNNQAILGRTDQAHKVLADLSADLSNSWFLAPDHQGAFSPNKDQPLAVLLRKIKTIDPSDSANLNALKLVGDLGIGGLEIILPDTALSKVMTIAWRGGNEGDAGGIADALALGLSDDAADFDQLLTLIITLPATAGDMLTAISEANEADATAKLLRIVSATTKDTDLLAPDQPLDIALFNSILVSLGEVRKVLAPQLSSAQHNSDDALGYLKTVPFINMQGGQPVLSSDVDFAADMQEMVDLALSYNLQATAEAAQKVTLGGVDIARLGINSLAPLLDNSRRSEAAEIQQRAIFDGLVGGDGFSGVSGGLQTEWDPNSTTARTDSEVTLEMYGQLMFEPFIGKNVGLMQWISNETGSYLFFEAVSEDSFIADMAGGLSGELKAELRAAEDQPLSLAYWGKSELQILSNTIAGAEAAGVLEGFPDPSTATTAQQYAQQLFDKLNIAQCASLTTQVLPFPLSMLALSGTATLGGAVEKTPGANLASTMRLGLSASLKSPVINSLLGITLGGNITTRYSGELVDGGVSFSPESCIAPDMTLTLLGQEIELIGSDIQSQTAIALAAAVTTTDLKFNISLNSEVVSEIMESGACDNLLDLLAQTICTPLRVLSGGNASLWLAIRGTASLELEATASLFFGIGAFPEIGDNLPYIKANIDTTSGDLTFFLPGITVGDWGGWDNSQSNFTDLCSENLCELNRFRSQPSSPQ